MAHLSVHHAAAPQAPVKPLAPVAGGRPGSRSRSYLGNLGRAGNALVALWLFIAAIQVMKAGAGALSLPQFLTDSMASTLGFGWLAAMVVMSGSPIAATSLAFLDAGEITNGQAFMMLTGSRLGAAFVVLMVAFIYAMTGRSQNGGRRASLSIGVFALVLTALAYIPGMIFGLPALHSTWIDRLIPADATRFVNVIGVVTDPVVAAVSAIMPSVLVFFAGLALLLASVKLLDRSLPTSQESALAEHEGWRSRKWIMFGLGSLIALVTMSVSVALTILVPLVAKGHLRRRHAIPYILGANVTTLGDTLLTAVLFENPEGVRVVLSELIGVFIMTMLLLVELYKPLTEGITRFTDYLLDSRPRTGMFLAALFCVPLALVAIG